MKTCWSCGTKVADESSACPRCGAGLSEEAMRLLHTVDGDAAAGLEITVGMLIRDRYEVKEKIGEGGMGVVFRAWDRTSSREVALKVIPRRLCLDPRAAAMLKQETDIALNLTHENIVRIYTPETWEGQFFIVMEYVDGGTLAHVFKGREQLSLAEALPYLEQIAIAIDYAHNARAPVIHRDLKPMNVLLTQDGIVKVADFGLARVLRDSASRISGHESAGTLIYMAPEQVRGKGIGRHTDIYALAAIAYELLCGRPPFYTGDLRWQIVHEEVEPIPGQPDQVNAALLAALAKDPESRPQSAGQFIRQLKGEEAVGAVPKKEKSGEQGREKGKSPGKGKAAGSPGGGTGPRSRRSVFVGLAAVLLLTVLAFAGWQYREGLQTVFRSGPLLTIETEPPGATVHIDGGKVRETPLQVDDLQPGTHQIRLTLDNYQVHEEKIFVEKGQPTDLNISLLPEPFGDMEISSTPSGATVTVDGKDHGTTPAQLRHLPQGSRQLVLSKDGYDDFSRQVDIVPLQPAQLNAELVTLYGGLSLSSEPAGAEVFIDGIKAGTTPFADDRITKGDRLVELIPGLGKLTVTSTPTGAQVFLGNQKLGTTPFTGDVPKGQQAVVLRLENYQDWQGEALIAVDSPASLQAELELAMGTLKIISDPAGGTVKVDGKEVGTSPLSLAHLPGTALVEGMMMGRKQAEQQVQVQAGRETLVSLKLELPASFTTDPTTGMEFVYVKGGCYQMGNTFGGGDSDEKPVHEVCVDDFYIGKYEVTQGEYEKIVGNNPSWFKNGDRYPVDFVSWDDAQSFLRSLNQQSGRSYRLPTEAEWEYAARSGGKDERYAGGEDVDALAWYDSNSGDSTHIVGGKRPNGLGIYDMSGNVWEWCQDWYDASYYTNSPRSNPTGPASGESRVYRGGCWFYEPGDVRSAFRGRNSPDYDSFNLGFRLLLQASEPGR